MEEKPNRSKGAFIPYHILFDDELSPREKMLWADINSMDTCYKSLDTLAEQHGINKYDISRTLSKLKKKGLIEEVDNNGRHKAWHALMDKKKPEELCSDTTESCGKAQQRVVKNHNSTSSVATTGGRINNIDIDNNKKENSDNSEFCKDITIEQASELVGGVMKEVRSRLNTASTKRLFPLSKREHYKTIVRQLRVSYKAKETKLAEIIVEWGGVDGLADAILGYVDNEYTKDGEQKMGDINYLLTKVDTSEAANWLSQYIKVELDDEQ